MNKSDNLKKQLEEIKREYSSAADIILEDREKRSSNLLIYSIIFFSLLFVLIFYFFSPSTSKVLFGRLKKIGKVTYEKPKSITLKVKIEKNDVKEKETEEKVKTENKVEKKVKNVVKKNNVIPRWRKPVLKKIRVKRKKKLTKGERALEILKEKIKRVKLLVDGKSEKYGYKGFSILKDEDSYLVLDLKVEDKKNHSVKHLIWKIDILNKKTNPIGFDTVNFESGED